MGALDGRLCIVTGASRGIGHAVVQRLLEEDADVIAVSRSHEGLSDLQQQYGEHMQSVLGDMCRVEDIDAVAQFVAKQQRPVHAVLPVVGGGPDTTVSETSVEVFDAVMDRNVKSSFFTVQRMLPMMVSGSAVVLFASIAGQQGGHDSVVYNASKAAVRSFAKTFAAELGPRGIRVNVVSPGPTDTEGFATYIHDDPERRKIIEGMSPLGRVGKPREVAAAAVFLASDESSFITGSEIIVDGGFF